MKNKTLYFLSLALFVSLSAAFGVAMLPPNANAQSISAPLSPCAFEDNLEVGSEGEEVRCLQKYLNTHGFKVSDSGVGSPGNETGSFGALTREAVKRWQIARGISPATGTFGPLSKTEYLGHVKTLLTAQLQNSSLNPTSISIPTTISTPVTPVVSVPVVSQAEKEAKAALKKAVNILEKTIEDVDDLDSDDFDAGDIEDMLEDIEDSEDDLREALRTFLDGDFDEAANQAEDVVSSMTDIADDIHGDGEGAQDAIDDAEEAIDDARNDIEEADDDGQDVRDAEELLEDAEDKLEDAQEAFDDEDFDDAEDLAQEAENLAEEAVDAIVE